MTTHFPTAADLDAIEGRYQGDDKNWMQGDPMPATFDDIPNLVEWCRNLLAHCGTVHLLATNREALVDWYTRNNLAIHMPLHHVGGVMRALDEDLDAASRTKVA